MHLTRFFCVVFGSRLLAGASKCDTYVDITDGVHEGDSVIKNGVRYTPENYFHLGETTQGCICNVKPCVRQCCLKGQTIDLTTRRCVTTAVEQNFPPFSVFNIIHVPENKICDDVEVKIRINEEFSVDEHGVLVWDDMTFSMDDFCLAYTPNNETYAIACVINEEAKVDSIITCLGNVQDVKFRKVTLMATVKYMLSIRKI